MLGLTFGEFADSVISNKLSQKNAFDHHTVVQGLESFHINITNDITKPSAKVKTKLAITDDEYIEDLFKKIDLNIDYQMYYKDHFIKSETVDGIHEKLFCEKDHDNLNWNKNVQEKINFHVNILLDIVGMLSRIIVELVPERFATFEQRYLLLINTAEKEQNKDEIKAFLDAQKVIYPDFKRSLVYFYNTLNTKMQNTKQFLEDELVKWKDNIHIKNVFAKAKRKIKNSLKSKLEEGAIDKMARQYVEHNTKIMEKFIEEINDRITMITYFKNIFSD